MDEYKWYKEVDFEDTLNKGNIVTQGDIIRKCPIVVLKETETYPFYTTDDGAEVLAIVMTQACDLENKKPKVKEISVCPLVPLKTIVDDIVSKRFNGMEPGVELDKRRAEVVNEIRQGNYLDFHLLNKYESENNPELNLLYNVVMLRSVYHIPVGSIQKIVHSRGGKRLRLLPPYREHLAQSYTFNFNRIGLPIDIKVDMKEL